MRAPEIDAWKSWEPPADGDDLRSWQDGRCAMCGYRDQRLVRDHCHNTGLIRGLLCRGCNTFEGQSSHRMWDAWRSGDHPAAAIKHYEIYTNQFGETSLSPQSALVYYTRAEQEAWWLDVVAGLKAGTIEWPLVAPWSEAATARRQADLEQMKKAMSGLFDFARLGMGAKSDEAAS